MIKFGINSTQAEANSWSHPSPLCRATRVFTLVPVAVARDHELLRDETAQPLSLSLRMMLWFEVGCLDSKLLPRSRSPLEGTVAVTSAEAIMYCAEILWAPWAWPTNCMADRTASMMCSCEGIRMSNLRRCLTLLPFRFQSVSDQIQMAHPGSIKSFSQVHPGAPSVQVATGR